MPRNTRQDDIMEILTQKQSATVHELCEELGVSGATIRRDLASLETEGMLRREFGGASLVRSSSDESAIKLRETENIDKKRRIAQRAVSLIHDNSSVFIDSSTTVGALIPLLKRFSSISVITNGVKNAMLLSQNTTAKVYMPSGVIRNKSNSILGFDTVEYLKRLHTDYAILSCSGFSVTNGFTETSLEQAQVKEIMLRNARCKIMLCDASKLDKIYLAHFGYPTDLDYLVTEAPLPPKYSAVLSELSCKLIVCQQV